MDNLRGSAQKAKEVLGWQPKVQFKQLVAMMVDGDLEKAKREKVLVDAGFIDSHQQPWILGTEWIVLIIIWNEWI